VQRLALVGSAAQALQAGAARVVEPRTGLSMGQSTEIMAKRWQITRAEQDQLAQQST